MANYWAIAIGINQYQHLQPLMYAQRDAQVFRDFLIKEAKFPAKQCFSLTDASPRLGRAESYPSRESIQACITRICQQRLQSGDFLWCFFSGYGMQVDGKDYLMPIDGNPAEVATTGIPIELLFSTFETAPTQNILLVLDVNRSQNVLPGEGVGDQTALLAKEHGIPVLLSCPPDQFSHETLALRQGLFTTALIEAMRYQGCTTLEAIVQYLSQRLPELSEHHWRPRQDPFAILPSEKKYALMMPSEAAAALSANAQSVGNDSDHALPIPSLPSADRDALSFNSIPSDSPWSFQYPPASERGYEEAEREEAGSSTAVLDPGWEKMTFMSSSDIPSSLPSDPNQFSSSQLNPRQPAPLESAPAIEPTDLSDALFWRRLLTWSGVIAAVLLLGVVIRNFGNPARKTTSPSAVEQGLVTQAESGVQGNPAIDQPNAQLPVQAEPGSPLESAYLSIRSRSYIDAKQFLAEVPAGERNQDYNQLLEEANKGLLSDAKVQLTKMRELMTENQAADFVDAIVIAQQVRPNEPQYREAQQYIDRWNRVILDMAQGRADRRNDSSTSIAAGNFGAAIKTAGLVSSDSPDVHRQAQEAIAHWSQRILDLADSRAAEGMYDVAIQTAENIPPGTAVYDSAQELIAVWREKPTLYQPHIP
ncbi:MAG: hypothetical protein Kow00121_35900 [Elainellaceae cyanobacterium]